MAFYCPLPPKGRVRSDSPFKEAHSCSASWLSLPMQEVGIRPQGQNRVLVHPVSAQELRDGEKRAIYQDPAQCSGPRTSCYCCSAGQTIKQPGQHRVPPPVLCLSGDADPQILAGLLSGSSEMNLVVSAEMCSANGLEDRV